MPKKVKVKKGSTLEKKLLQIGALKRKSKTHRPRRKKLAKK